MREVKAADVRLPIPLADAFLVAGIVESKAAARRAVLEGGAYVNNEKVGDPEMMLDREHLLADWFIVLRRGRKTAGGVKVTQVAVSGVIIADHLAHRGRLPHLVLTPRENQQIRLNLVQRDRGRFLIFSDRFGQEPGRPQPL